MPNKKRSIPPRLMALRERDEAAFRTACRKGGRKSAEVRRNKKNKKSPVERTPEELDILAEVASEEKKRNFIEILMVGWERHDEELPDP